MRNKTNKTATQKSEFTNRVLEIQNTLNKLQGRQSTWRDGLYRAANNELYEILAQCFQLHEQIKDNNGLKAALKKYLDSLKINVNLGTSLQTRIVRFVFGEGAQQYTYARTIRVASTLQIPVSDFEDWLRGEGGPDGVKRKNSEKAKNNKTKSYVDAAKAHFERSPKVSSVELSDCLRKNDSSDHDFSIALVRPCAKDASRVEIVFGSSNSAIVQAALRLAGSTLTETERQKALSVSSAAITMSDEQFALLSSPSEVQ